MVGVRVGVIGITIATQVGVNRCWGKLGPTFSHSLFYGLVLPGVGTRVGLKEVRSHLEAKLTVRLW